MKNISLNLSISLTEYGISGFTLKYTTGISTSSIYPEVSQISANYLRTKDIVFIDLITLNTIDNPKVSDFYYVCHSILAFFSSILFLSLSFSSLDLAVNHLIEESCSFCFRFSTSLIDFCNSS